jgi:hypothetical protein
MERRGIMAAAARKAARTRHYQRHTDRKIERSTWLLLTSKSSKPSPHPNASLQRSAIALWAASSPSFRLIVMCGRSRGLGDFGMGC